MSKQEQFRKHFPRLSKGLKDYADIKGKNLLVVYNGLHPEILFNSNDVGLKDNILTPVFCKIWGYC